VSFILIYLALGMFAGILAGMLGVGGGIVVVPALLWIFKHQGFEGEIITHLAIGTSLSAIVFTSLSAIWAQHKRAAIDWAVVRQLAPATLLGGLISGYLAGFVGGATLKMAFSIFLLLVSIQLLANWQVSPHWKIPGRMGLWLAGLAIGSISAMMGIGGGTITVPFLHACNVEMRRAIAISTTLGFPIALFGGAGFVLTGWGHPGLPPGSLGYLFLPALLAITVPAILTAPLGVRLAHHLPVKALKRVFGAIVLVVSIRLLSGG
jgi:uncharacterized membrane protein YfcA